MSEEELKRIRLTLYWSLLYFRRNGGDVYYQEDIEKCRQWLKTVIGDDPYDDKYKNPESEKQ